MRHYWLLVLLAIFSDCVWAQEPPDRAGESFHITVFHESKSEEETGSSSSSGRHEYIERIVAIRNEGVERVFDITRQPDEKSQLIDWQFPVRIFEANDGKMEIVNRGDMEARRDAWLEAAEIPFEACGTWYFTWNAFQVECDPEAILETVRRINIQPENLEDGASFSHPAAIRPGSLQKLNDVGSEFRVRMVVDEEHFHRSAAQNDVIVGEIMGEPITFDEAYERRTVEQITGTIEVILTVSESGRVAKQVTSIETTKIKIDGKEERSVSNEVIERTET